MKRTRILIALLTVVLLTVGMPLSALAAAHEVGTADEIHNAIATDTDAEVTLNMKNDIDMECVGIYGNEGQTYTINGNGSAISNVVIESGEFTVNADMDGDNTAVGDADVTVNGDIETVGVLGEAALDVTGDVETVYAGEDTTVNITGDVGHLDACGNTTVEITGDIVGEEGGYSGINAWDQAQVSVDGNVYGADGVIAPEDKDDPTASASGSSGIEAYDKVTITVTGDVSGGDGVLSDAAMEVPEMYGDGGSGINASGDVTISVGGDVTGGNAMGTFGYSGTGISAWSGAEITVEGNVTAGDVTANPEVEPFVEKWTDEETGEEYERMCTSNAGDGISSDSTTTITVGGNVTGGNTSASNGLGGDGLELECLGEDADGEKQQELGTITIGGTVSGGTGDAGSKEGKNGYDVEFEGVIGYSKSALEQLGKMRTEDFLDEDNKITSEFSMIMEVLLVTVDEEKLSKAYEEWMKETGYADEDTSKWSEEEANAFYKDYVEFIVDLYGAEVDAQNVDITALNEARYADKFAKLSIGAYDEDPTFCSYDDESGMKAAAYMNDNVKALPATPATGDSFNMVLVSAVAFLALLGMSALLVIRKKHA